MQFFTVLLYKYGGISSAWNVISDPAYSSQVQQKLPPLLFVVQKFLIPVLDFSLLNKFVLTVIMILQNPEINL